MMRLRPAAGIFPLITLLCAVCGCADKPARTPVPLPYGYQRAVLLDSVYTVADSLPGLFAVNAGARVERLPSSHPSAVQADIRYDAYGATLHLTFTEVDSITAPGVVANRTERMAFNLADNFATVTTVQPSAQSPYTSTIMLSTGRIPTPVQLLCVSPHLVVSGALQFDSPQFAPDSVMPVLNAVVSDIQYAAARLR